MVCDFAKMPLSFFIFLPTVCARLSGSVTHRNCGFAFSSWGRRWNPTWDHDSWLNMNVCPMTPVRNHIKHRYHEMPFSPRGWSNILQKFPSCKDFFTCWFYSGQSQKLTLISDIPAIVFYAIFSVNLATNTTHKISGGKKKKKNSICGWLHVG